MKKQHDGKRPKFHDVKNRSVVLQQVTSLVSLLQLLSLEAARRVSGLVLARQYGRWVVFTSFDLSFSGY